MRLSGHFISSLIAMFFCIGTPPSYGQTQENTLPQDTTLYHFSHLWGEGFSFPRFPGQLENWLYGRLEYPESAREAKQEGRVFVSFVIEKDGTVSQARILRGVSPGLDAEALAVVSRMPLWSPATKIGEPIRVIYTLPILFSLKAVVQPAADQTLNGYLQHLNEEEKRLKTPVDSLQEARSVRIFSNYLLRRYGSSDNTYKNLLTESMENRQSAQISLGITLPRVDIPAQDKEKVLHCYTEEWEEEQRLLDSIPREEFIAGYARINSRLQDNSIRRELKIRSLLSNSAFRKYVDGCIIRPSQLIHAVVANPLAGKWEKVVGTTASGHPIFRTFEDNFQFTVSDGTTGTYKLGSGQSFSEDSDHPRQPDIIGYKSVYHYRLNGNTLSIQGEKQLKINDGSVRYETIRETWKRVD